MFKRGPKAVDRAPGYLYKYTRTHIKALSKKRGKKRAVCFLPRAPRVSRVSPSKLGGRTYGRWACLGELSNYLSHTTLDATSALAQSLLSINRIVYSRDV